MAKKQLKLWNSVVNIVDIFEFGIAQFHHVTHLWTNDGTSGLFIHTQLQLYFTSKQ